MEGSDNLFSAGKTLLLRTLLSSNNTDDTTESDYESYTPTVYESASFTTESAAGFLIFGVIVGFVWAAYNMYTVRKVSMKSGSTSRGGVNCDYLLEEAGKDVEKVMKRAKDIAKAIEEGGEAFLKSQATYLFWYSLLFLSIMFIIIGAADGWDTEWDTDTDSNGFESAPLVYNGLLTVISAAIGGFTCFLCSYAGLKMSTYSTLRTALEARRALKYSYQCNMRAASSIGMFTAAAALLNLFLLVIIYQEHYGTRDNESLYLSVAGYALGASMVAMFQRLSGGLYSKATSMGLSMVGNVNDMDVHAQPADDPRNPAVIADNVGLLVYSVVGSLSDLFASSSEAVCATLVLLSFTTAEQDNDFAAMSYPLVFMAISMISCSVAVLTTTYIRPARSEKEPELVLKQQVLIAALMQLFLSYCFAVGMLPDKVNTTNPNTKDEEVEPHELWFCVAAGLSLGVTVARAVEHYVSPVHQPVQHMAESCKKGEVSTVMFGLALGYTSTLAISFCAATTAYLSYHVAEFYGVGFAALGAVGTFSLNVSLESFSAIGDNAFAIAEMSGLHEEARDRCLLLSLAGKSVASIIKGFSIGITLLVVLANWTAYMTVVEISNTIDEQMILGFFIGAALPYWFCSLLMMAIGKASSSMAEEVCKQFNLKPGILDGTAVPEYKTCVQIATHASLKEMRYPGLFVLSAPIVIGIFLGNRCLSGTIFGGLLCGLMLAISSTTSGAAWINTTKYIATGGTGTTDESKPAWAGSAAYKASLLGATMGMPLQDLGPFLSSYLKLMVLEALIIAPFLRDYSGRGLILDIWS